jgi:hypothetical protein
MAAPIDEPELKKELEGISQRGQVSPQGSSGSISDIQLADEPGIIQASAVQVVQGFAVPVELALVETDGLSKDLIFARLRQVEFLVQMNNGFVKREMEVKLDKANKVAPAAAAVAVEDIFGCVDVERRMAFRMQWTQTNELLMGADWPCRPVALLQIIQQREPLFQILQVMLLHTRSFTRR